MLDCDGVLTNGEITYDDRGNRTLSFYARDGLGLAVLCRSGVKAAVLLGMPQALPKSFREVESRYLREFV